jgi:predicted O-linked N-acetylglucosamine transferase (SPINDLY family)
MTNLGLADWVAQNEQEYEDKAVGFAQDISNLITVRGSMRSKMEASPVMDDAAFAGDVEDAFKAMWQSWVDGQ